MKKLVIALLLISFSAQAKETTLEEKKAWAKRSCESLKIYNQGCVVEQIDYAPKWK